MKKEQATPSSGSVANIVSKGGRDSTDCSEDQNNNGSRDHGGQNEPEKPRSISSGRHVLAMFFAFLVSSVVHEAMAFIAMRRTFWPFNSFSLILCVVVISRWDRMYPLQCLISVKRGASSTDKVGRQVEGAGIAKKRLIGSEWRGWGAVAYYEITSLPMALFYDFLSWQWWRYSHLRHD